jgi:hypothetical protein
MKVLVVFRSADNFSSDFAIHDIDGLSQKSQPQPDVVKHKKQTSVNCHADDPFWNEDKRLVLLEVTAGSLQLSVSNSGQEKVSDVLVCGSKILLTDMKPKEKSPVPQDKQLYSGHKTMAGENGCTLKVRKTSFALCDLDQLRGLNLSNALA